MTTAPTRYQPKCYYATPEYANSLWGQYVYIYQGQGGLSLDAGRLSFQSRSLEFDIPLASIRGLGMGEFSRASKPFGLSYLSVRYEEGGKEKTVYLVPAVSALAPTWATSRLVESWFESIRTAGDFTDRIDWPIPARPEPSYRWLFLLALGIAVPFLVGFGLHAWLRR